MVQESADLRFWISDKRAIGLVPQRDAQLWAIIINRAIDLPHHMRDPVQRFCKGVRVMEMRAEIRQAHVQWVAGHEHETCTRQQLLREPHVEHAKW